MSYIKHIEDAGTITSEQLQATALLAIAEQMRAANIIAMANVPQLAYETQSDSRWEIVEEALK